MSSKIVITRKKDNVVTNIVDTAIEVENGLKVKDNTMGEYIIAFINECNVYESVEVDTLAIIPQKYKYTVEDGFVVNPSFKSNMSTDEQIQNLQKGLLEAQNAINLLLGV